MTDQQDSAFLRLYQIQFKELGREVELNNPNANPIVNAALEEKEEEDKDSVYIKLYKQQFGGLR
jgi:hypothetical protein